MEPSASGTGPGRSGSGAVSWSALVGTYLPALILALGAGVALPAVPAAAPRSGWWPGSPPSRSTPPPTSAAARLATPRPSLREMVAPRLAYFGVAFFAGLTPLLHLYAAYAYRLGPRAIGLLATVAASVTLPIGFVAGWVMDRYGRERAMVPGFLGVMLAMAGLAVAAYLLLPFGWYVALFLAGVVATALTGGSVQTIGADVAPDGARGRFLGVWRFTGLAPSGAPCWPVRRAYGRLDSRYTSGYKMVIPKSHRTPTASRESR